jgi:hypothetical protein
MEGFIMPKTMKYFEWSYLISIGIGIIIVIYQYDIIAVTFTDFGGGFSAVIAQVLSFGISLLLVLLTSRKKNSVTKWVLTVFFVIGLVFFVMGLLTIQRLGLSDFLSIIQILAQCCGMYFLFSKSSRDWFKKEV